ncbi:hypothetical protein CAPTEDRAFT_217421 [Capitella teleta]|uniref:G-protein coupled receptors family 1 profile domain-containing protein n=1 Tax=Capitella teleta TaxID=283909 RepID=R7T7R0_CAPTE|nr:hypothetical protein CAPTEDRAFT_217421 [Capitella teleta]|eukprot:ELT89645.1 hypothetical protein CAPTEDRAFT_217421 [Capitella teleta]
MACMDSQMQQVNFMDVATTSAEYFTLQSDECLSAASMNHAHFRVSMPIVVMMTVFMVTGILGNVVVLVVYINKRKKAVANNYMMSLAGIDLFSCSIIHPYVIYKIKVVYNPDSSACRLFEFLNHASLCTQVCILLSVAIDRFYTVCKPLKYIQAYQRSILLIVLSYTIGSLGSIPLLVFYGQKTMGNQPHCSQTVYICHYSDQYDGSVHQLTYGACALLIMSCMLLAIGVLYARVVTSIVKGNVRVKPIISPALEAQLHRIGNTRVSGFHKPRELKVAELVACGSSSDSRANSFNRRQGKLVHFAEDHMHSVHFQSKQLKNRQTDNQPTNMHRGVRIAKVLFTVTAIFIISWIPFWTLHFIALHRNEEWGDHLDSIARGFCNHLYFLNNSVNPFIFVFTNKAFRCDCLSFWKKIKRRFQKMR